MATASICVITKHGATDTCILGISETPTSIGTFKWRWLQMKLKISLRSMKKGFTASTMEAIHLLDNSELVRRLKRKKNLLSWCSDH